MKIEPGSATAYEFNGKYRLDRVSKYITGGDWLDYGCAEGAYTVQLLDFGADKVIGIDAEADRVAKARELHPDIEFFVNGEDRLPDASFDGVFMNEVFEHVADEDETLRDVYRMLRPGGVLVLIAPNRGFPFEGHGMHIGPWDTKRPTAIVPWLPRSLTDSWVTARNYWPRELREMIATHGFRIIEAGFVMPVFEGYPWIPESVAKKFRSKITVIDQLPGVRRLGVSNLIVGKK